MGRLKIRCLGVKVPRPAKQLELGAQWGRALAIDPVEQHVQLIDGHQFVTAAAGKHGPFLIAHVHANWVLSNVKLSIDDAQDDASVVLLHHLGLPDEKIIETTWSNIDKVIEADHLTCMYVPHLSTSVGEELVRFHELARTLREQCPWDKEQTHQRRKERGGFGCLWRHPYAGSQR